MASDQEHVVKNEEDQELLTFLYWLLSLNSFNLEVLQFINLIDRQRLTIITFYERIISMNRSEEATPRQNSTQSNQIWS